LPARARPRRERARFRLHLVRKRTALKQRVHATRMSHGQPCPVSDLFGAGGRRLLASLTLPEPWAGTLAASLRLLDELEREIAAIERELAVLGRAHPYVPLLETVPGIGCVLGYTIAAEIGDIARFSSPSELAGYTGLARACTSRGRAIGAVPSPRRGPGTCVGH
jgi:transposase